MATLILTSLASSVAGSFGFSAFATAALSAGAGLVGNFIDQKLFGQTIKSSQEGPRLDEVRFTGSSEGVPINRIAGRARVAGNIIWTTKYREEIITTTTTTGGGKGGSGGSKSTVTTTEYRYYVSFAIAVCEGPVIQFGRIWADGAILDQSKYTIRFYKGTQTQFKDPKILATEGADFTSAFRGIAYVVFEEMLLSDGFANRIPQINVEVYKSEEAALNELENKVKAITIIPASGEFAYGTSEVLTYDASTDTSTTQNNHTNTADTDWVTSIDQLENIAPNLENPSLVVAWHGTDLRVGNCNIQPRVETATKNEQPYEWEVSGVTRSAATVVSYTDGAANVGGAVSDRAVKEAIEDMNSRGLAVTFYPFILMDIPAGNGLPDPYGGSEQAAFPWRGRITLANSSDDQTVGAKTQVDSFFGSAAVGHFGAWNGNTIPYSGPNEFKFRRMILHYANLCAAAGGVDSFIIGSEMVKLNHIRDNNGNHPAVDQFVTLAADVKAILGSSTKVTYAADWSEFPNYRPSDGSNDVIFHLDKLWANANIDTIGIDNYMPISDWRDTADHLDAENYNSIYNLDYLKSNIAGGEGFDWYYASDSDRLNQVRTPIVDTGYGEDWIFAYKDLVNWWQNPHHNRPGGVRSGSSTLWVPESKPIWFTEVGCPAVDKGTNQPNVFIDPKSSETSLPYFSSGDRDDFIQRQYNIALIEYWAELANNPISGVYSGSMVDTNRMYIWTWDARPFPEFPFRDDVWSDGSNWEKGHWLNGRLGLPTLKAFVEATASPFNITTDASDLYGLITGYIISDTLSARQILQPLMSAYFFDAFESEGQIKFQHRGNSPVLALIEDDLVMSGSSNKFGGPFTLTRSQLTELPNEVRAKFILDDYNYTATALSARRLIGTGADVAESSYSLVLNTTQAQSMVDTQLIEAHVSKELVETRLPPSLLRLDASDVINLTLNSRSFDFRLEEIGYEYYRSAKGVQTVAATYKRSPGPALRRNVSAEIIIGLSTTVFMNLPMLRDSDVPHAPWFAASAQPWPGAVATFRSTTTTAYTQDNTISIPSVLGSTLVDLPAAIANIWDDGSSLQVTTNSFGTLSSADDLDVFAGANVGALYNASLDEWEVFQWANAEPGPSTNTWILSGLLRGQQGTEKAIGDPLPAGSRFVVIDSPLIQSNVDIALLNLTLNWQYGPASDSIGDQTYVATTFTPKGTGLRPYSPTSLSAAKSVTSNDITLDWIRRTRIGGEIWDNSDVPLSEDFEKYEIDIFNAAGNAVLRTIEVSDVTTYVYTIATQVADFGISPLSLTFEVFQISATVGRGTGRKHTATFRF